MRRVSISFQGGIQAEVWSHLRSNPNDEEAAFLFADVDTTPRGVTLHVRSWFRVQPSDFEERGINGIVLTEECRAALIKRAHDEGRSLIECHSHPGSRAAVFSLYDFEGFNDFVPHVRWRLKGRPYAALVIAETTFDALAWIEQKDSQPRAVDAVIANDKILYPTRRSITRWQEAQHGQQV